VWVVFSKGQKITTEFSDDGHPPFADDGENPSVHDGRRMLEDY
jgi:hypothetical protein